MKLLVGKGSHGMYKNWQKKDDKHRRQCKLRGVFESCWPENGGPLPWRLTKEQVQLLDTRMSNVMWPHYMERLFYRGASCWIKSNRMWKARRKYRMLFFVMVTQLRDQVPALRNAIVQFVWGMRRLEGQVHSYEAARSPQLNILPGSRTISKDQIREMDRDVKRGLVMVEGSTPIDHLNPGLHHFCHAGEYTQTHYSLRGLWMMCFER